MIKTIIKREGKEQMDYHYKKTLAEFNLEDLNMDIEALSEGSDLLLCKLLTIQLIIEELVTYYKIW